MEKTTIGLSALAVMFLIATLIDSCDSEACALAGGSSSTWQLLNITVGPPSAYLALILLLYTFDLWRKLKRAN